MLGGKYERVVLGAILGTLAVAVILQIPIVRENQALIASLASTTYMVFLLPENPAVNAVSIVVGYLLSASAGEIAIHLNLTPALQGAVAVGLAMLFMELTNKQHPPAAGISLGAVINQATLSNIVGVITGVLVLVGILLAVKIIAKAGKKHRVQHPALQYFHHVDKHVNG